ncbi:hypothetical protein XELAEV_18039511mg [Xenopus laevis]|uniref:Reverse transcriptase domain-containing protein n=1 Tax=Xenopus laevis TaxID=8355 RepID=A0A974C7Y9_XENLA|nr:hypothetical protein XELAEV_18039511mg [Xenopus laevis]
MDVESLYPNIPQHCQHFLEKNHMPTVPTLQLIRFILTHNYFSLGDAKCLQLMGSAMGSKMHQKKNLAFHQRFNQFHPTINLTLNHSYSHINFLDTTIYIKNGQTSLYQKSTGHPAYLMWDNTTGFAQTLMTEINISIPYGKLLLIRDTIHRLFDDQIHRTTQIHRDTLLDYKEKTENNRGTLKLNGKGRLNTLKQGLNLGSGFMSHYVI